MPAPAGNATRQETLGRQGPGAKFTRNIFGKRMFSGGPGGLEQAVASLESVP